MEIVRSTRDGCLIVAFTGSIDLLNVSQVQRVLLKDLSDQPAALICDLAGVPTLDPVCATVFSTVANNPVSSWPTTSFLLCGAQPPVAEILGGLQVPHFLRLYADVDAAIDGVMARPPYLLADMRLAATLTAPGSARAFVREVCRSWRLDRPDATVTERAELVASELVTNAVVHSGTEIRLRLELRGDRLHIAVRDGSPGQLRQVAPERQGESGRGLWLVEQLAHAWGVHRHPDGGEVVWCTLKL